LIWGYTIVDLALEMRLKVITPFLDRWHANLQEWEKANPDTSDGHWPGNQACRDDMNKAQAHLRCYALNFGRLAGIRWVEDIVTGRRTPPPELKLPSGELQLPAAARQG
jgi:hypothetical protein